MVAYLVPSSWLLRNIPGGSEVVDGSLNPYENRKLGFGVFLFKQNFGYDLMDALFEIYYKLCSREFHLFILPYIHFRIKQNQ